MFANALGQLGALIGPERLARLLWVGFDRVERQLTRALRLAAGRDQRVQSPAQGRAAHARTSETAGADAASRASTSCAS